ncbi:MAG: hypothetical protein E7482_03365 [Ruminococcaceae bacterium]|nr:hypothetical protein [Oscillospiraceae bacterium]
MRKIILSFVFLFLFSGCSNSVSVTPQEVAKRYEQDFSSSVLAVFGDNRAEMEVLKNGMSISIFANSPAELSGMGIEIFDEHAKITYNGMEEEIKKIPFRKERLFCFWKNFLKNFRIRKNSP